MLKACVKGRAALKTPDFPAAARNGMNYREKNLTILRTSAGGRGERRGRGA